MDGSSNIALSSHFKGIHSFVFRHRGPETLRWISSGYCCMLFWIIIMNNYYFLRVADSNDRSAWCRTNDHAHDRVVPHPRQAPLIIITIDPAMSAHNPSKLFSHLKSLLLAYKCSFWMADPQSSSFCCLLCIASVSGYQAQRLSGALQRFLSRSSCHFWSGRIEYFLL